MRRVRTMQQEEEQKEMQGSAAPGVEKEWLLSLL